jgi:4'-phosphopantetheinyl transferase EntD
MLERLLPAEVSVAANRGDIPDASLFPEEEEAIGGAIERRRREFATARTCARRALVRLGVAPQPILPGPGGAPSWPAGIVGSITHCDGYRGCAVARVTDLLSIGIDAEPNQPLPQGLLADIGLERELVWVERLRREMPEVHWDRLLFCMKEATYKAWFPLMGRWLGFEDAIVSVAPAEGTFSARLLVPGPVAAGREMSVFRGRWIVGDGIALAAITVPPSP